MEIHGCIEGVVLWGIGIGIGIGMCICMATAERNERVGGERDCKYEWYDVM